MKKIILVSNRLYKYRAHVYEEFIKFFKEENIEFKIVITVDSSEESFGLPPDCIDFLGSSIKKLKYYLDEEKPSIIINFLHPTNLSIWFVYWYSFRNKIQNIYWNHGVNLQDPDNKIKLLIYNFLHTFSDAIILYSKNELKFIKTKYHDKTFIANNTINFNKIPKIISTKKEIKEKLNINFEKTVLFVGRVQPRKKLEVLIEVFKKSKFQNYGLLIVGPDLPESIQENIIGIKNIMYLGAIYDDLAINEVFKISDVFCIPGTNGLGLNQAMYWGLPCIALDVLHSPEIIYLEDNKNGFIVSSVTELQDKIDYLLKHDNIYNQFSSHAKSVITKKADITIMFKGFINAVRFVMSKKNNKQYFIEN